MGLGISDVGYLQYAVETTQGTFVSPTDPLFIETNTLDSTYDMVRKSIFGNSRSARRLVGHSLAQQMGQIGGPVYADAGAVFYKALFGSDAWFPGNDATAYGGVVASIDAAAASASGTISTTANTLTITLVATSIQKYRPGALVAINCSGTGTIQASTSIRPLIDMTVTGSTSKGVTALVFPLYPGDTTALYNGVKIAQLSCMRFYAANNTTTLPSLSLETNINGNYANQYAGVGLEKAGFKVDKDYISQTFDCYGSVNRVTPGSPTAFAATTAEYQDNLVPFVSSGTVLCAPQDATASGTLAVGLHNTPESIEVDFNNGFVKRPYIAGQSSYQWVPGTREFTAKYKYDIQSNSDGEFVQYLASANFTKTFPIIVAAAQGLSTAFTKPVAGFSIYLPACSMNSPKQNKVLGQVASADIEVEALPQSEGGTWGEWTGSMGSNGQISKGYSNNVAEIFLVNQAIAAPSWV